MTPNVTIQITSNQTDADSIQAGPGTALPQDLPALITLWHRCFGESIEESGYYLHHRFHPEEIYVWRIDGRVCAMIHLIPVVMNGLRGGYLYAIATDPAMQGQGICHRLHAYVCEQAKAMGYEFLCLIPASESLFAFYGRMGYEVWFKKEQYSVNAIISMPKAAPGTLGYTENATDASPSFCTETTLFPKLSCPQVTSAGIPESDKQFRFHETAPDILLPILSEAPFSYCTADDLRMALELHAHYEGVCLGACCRLASEPDAKDDEDSIQEEQSVQVSMDCSHDHSLPPCSRTDQVFFAAGYCEDGELTLNFSDNTDRHALLSAAVPYAKAQDCHTLTLLFQTESDADAPVPTRTPYAMGLWLTTPQPEQIPPQIGLMYT